MIKSYRIVQLYVIFIHVWFQIEFRSPSFLRPDCPIETWEDKLFRTVQRSMRRNPACSYVLIPMLLRSHFSLVILDLTASVVMYMNSLESHSLSENELSSFIRALGRLSGRPASLNRVAMASQTIEGNDCGFFLCNSILCFVSSGPTAIPPPVDAEFIRLTILKIVAPTNAAPPSYLRCGF